MTCWTFFRLWEICNISMIGVITDHDLWYAENCPAEVRRRWK